MWGDPDDYKPPTILSDIAKGVPASKWLLLVAVFLLAVLGALYWQFHEGIFSSGEAAPAGPLVPIEYRKLTSCTIDDNLSCEGTVLSNDGILLVISNPTNWDILEGNVALRSAIPVCEFEGGQTVRLLPAGSSQMFNFSCVTGTGFNDVRDITATIRLEYKRDNEPLMQYAMGLINSTSEAVTK